MRFLVRLDLCLCLGVGLPRGVQDRTQEKGYESKEKREKDPAQLPGQRTGKYGWPKEQPHGDDKQNDSCESVKHI